MDGDTVAVELLPFSKWRKRIKAESSESVSDSMASLHVSDAPDPLWQPAIDVNENASEAKPFDASKDECPFVSGSLARAVYSKVQGEGNSGVPLQPCGRVVGIIAASEASAMDADRDDHKEHVGRLYPMSGSFKGMRKGDPLGAKENYVKFCPLDKAVPTMLVPRAQVPHEWLGDPVGYNTPSEKIYLCALGAWKATSEFPQGRLIRQLGEVGDISTETEALLIDNNVDHGEFPADAMECLNEFAAGVSEDGKTRAIPEEEIGRRRDYRTSRCIFTIDPPTAKDLDDALHCVRVPANTVKDDRGTFLPEHYEIGVHIADVSYFLKPNTALDREARRRVRLCTLSSARCPCCRLF